MHITHRTLRGCSGRHWYSPREGPERPKSYPRHNVCINDVTKHLVNGFELVETGYGRPYAVMARPLCFTPVVSFFSLPIVNGRRLDVYHTSTHGLSANLECRSEMCCIRLGVNTECKNLPSADHCTTFLTISLQLRHISTIAKKLVKQQRLLYMSSQYGELRPTNG